MRNTTIRTVEPRGKPVSSDHLTDDELQAYIDDGADPAERHAASAHLADCAECAKCIEIYRVYCKIVSAVHTAVGSGEESRSPHLSEISAVARAQSRNESIAAAAMSHLRTLPIDDWIHWILPQESTHCYAMVVLLLGEARAHATTSAANTLAILSSAEQTVIRITDARDRAFATALVQTERATASRLWGRHDDALDALDIAEETIGEYFAPDDLARIAWNRACVFYAMKRHAHARRWLGNAMDWYGNLHGCAEVAYLHVLEAALLFTEGDVARTSNVLTQAARGLEALNQPATLARVYECIADCRSAEEKLDEHSQARLRKKLYQLAIAHP